MVMVASAVAVAEAVSGASTSFAPANLFLSPTLLLAASPSSLAPAEALPADEPGDNEVLSLLLAEAFALLPGDGE